MNRIPPKTIAGALAALSLLWVLNGCSRTTVRSGPRPEGPTLPVEAPAPAAPPSTYVHVVRWQGETLSSIAEWYTGSWQNWKALARANPEVDPERIEIGNRLRIPKTLLKTRNPMPSDFLPTTPVKKTVRTTAPQEPRGKPAPRFYVHVVQWQNETFSFIAKWYTGSWQNWEALAASNPELDPKGIRIGDRIRIPEALLKTRNPLPADFIPKAVTKKTVKPATPRDDAGGEGGPVRTLEGNVTGDAPNAPAAEAERFDPVGRGQPPPLAVSPKMGLFGPGEIGGARRDAEEAELFGPIE